MASINGVSGNNMMSSLYNSRNIVSGLASGLDTEGMIEGLVQGYQQKINGLNQKVTKIGWQQEAYRSIISKMVAFTNKYTSFSSSTNLLSSSFFNNAMKVVTSGMYADRVTASGRSDSDIVLNNVSQLATSARYVTGSELNRGDGKTIEADTALDLDGKTTLGTLQGSLSLTYGSKTISINFDQVSDVERMDELRAKLKNENGKDPSETEVLAALINDKLSNEKITLNSGETVSATDRIKVDVDLNGIVFSDKSDAKNSVYLSGASGNVANVLGLNLDNAEKDRPSAIIVKDLALTKDVDNVEYLSGKTLNMNLDGVNRTIKLPKITKNEDGTYTIKDKDGKDVTFKADGTEDSATMDKVHQAYADALNSEMEKAYGGKVSVNLTDGKLNFKLEGGATNLLINSDVGETLGIGRVATSYMNTDKTLGKLLKDGAFDNLTPSGKDDKGRDLYEFKLNGVVIGEYTKDTKLSEIMSDINENAEAGVKVSYSKTTGEFVFNAKETGADGKIDFGDGLAQAMFGKIEMNGGQKSFAEAYGLTWLQPGDTGRVTFSIAGSGQREMSITRDTSIEDVVDNLNKSIMGTDNVFSFNEYTGKIEATNKKTGAAAEIDIKDPYNDPVKFDERNAPKGYTAGQDAKFSVTINGTQMEMTRSSNSVNIDGMTLNFKDTFDSSVDKDGKPVSNPGANGVSFKSTSDADKIVDAVKDMIKDYNEMIGEIKKAYSTLPAQKTNGSSYEPLTDDQMSDLSESAQKNYEEKAKQGILFGDSMLSGLYEKLSYIFSPAGEDGGILRQMGISETFSAADNTMSITLDEDKLRAMLDSDPDKVMEAFTKSTENGASTDGVMQNLKTYLDSYAKLTGEPKGLLVQHAGTPLSSLSLLDNTLQDKIDSLNDEVEKWQDKLADQVDRYTSQFSRLEMLINQMNSQSSTLMGMMGG